jgi:hypothetical protein
MLMRNWYLLPDDALNDVLKLVVSPLPLKHSGATATLRKPTSEPRNSNTSYDNDTTIGCLR